MYYTQVHKYRYPKIISTFITLKKQHCEIYMTSSQSDIPGSFWNFPDFRHYRSYSYSYRNNFGPIFATRFAVHAALFFESRHQSSFCKFSFRINSLPLMQFGRGCMLFFNGTMEQKGKDVRLSQVLL